MFGCSRTTRGFGRPRPSRRRHTGEVKHFMPRLARPALKAFAPKDTLTGEQRKPPVWWQHLACRKKRPATWRDQPPPPNQGVALCLCAVNLSLRALFELRRLLPSLRLRRDRLFRLHLRLRPRESSLDGHARTTKKSLLARPPPPSARAPPNSISLLRDTHAHIHSTSLAHAPPLSTSGYR
ncbi:hypothetical protein FIBSPDRAFT_904904 [Athelia psychrophila]|uniref:Uncharacterized protein n=1 Tax=Athelia psychrophila TaxID=1759441 RepID=A0A167U587_9AGAM|nr:hypothetical protein FIBSPDRAFT_904904 [Fibularhizoctonia sp. CBS 109695]